MVWRGAVTTAGGTPAPSGVVATYDSASVAEARAVLAHGIERRVAVLTLTGKSGAGTTSVLRSLAERFGGEFELVMPVAPPMSLAELSVPVLRLLGRPFVDGPGPSLLAAIKDAVAARAPASRPMALLLDDADGIPDDVLGALDALHATDDSEQARVSVVLAGRPGLLARLAGRRMAALRRGLTIDVRLHAPAPVRVWVPSVEPRPAPVLRLARRTRALVLATLGACLCAAAVLYLDTLPRNDQRERPTSPPIAMVPGARPSALAALVVPRPADAAAPAAPPLPGARTTEDEARRVVRAFQAAATAGDREALRTLLAADVRYNGVAGIEAALDDQAGRTRAGDAPRFAPVLAVTAEDGTIRVEGAFAVTYRDVAGMPGDVTGRAVWRLATRGGRLRIVAVDYDVVPLPDGRPPES